jgi:dTDP-4-amino-4,6-dideoxygalactose transaminase
VTPVPFYSLDPLHAGLKEEMIRWFESFFDSTSYILGRAVEEFEVAYARFNGTRHCVGVGSGFDALYLALQALGVGEGDEVIVPSHTFVATWLAVSHTGATVVPVEPDPTTCNIDPARIEEAVTPRTRAVVPVHLYGRPCDLNAVLEIGDRHGIAVVEDNAQAHGAECRGRRTGSCGRINATSFYPTKILGALGDAGAVTTDDADLAERVRMMRNYGSRRKDLHEVIGVNSRMDEIQAGFLAIKLGHVDRWIAERRRAASWYREALQGVEGLTLPSEDAGFHHVYHLFVVRTLHRDGLRKHLADNSIQTMVHYPVPPHLQEACRGLGLSKGQYPVAEELADTTLSLPLFVGITREQVQTVSSHITEFLERGVGG